MNDCKFRVLITSDEGRCGGKTIATIKQCPGIQHVLALSRTGNEVPWAEGRDKWWHQETAKVSNYCPPEILSTKDSLFILYVRRILLRAPQCIDIGSYISDSTGKPKGGAYWIPPLRCAHC